MRPARQEMQLGLPVACPSEMNQNPVPSEMPCPEPQPHLPAGHLGTGLCRGQKLPFGGQEGTHSSPAAPGPVGRAGGQLCPRLCRSFAGEGP